jgi:hypothetical protein
MAFIGTDVADDDAKKAMMRRGGVVDRDFAACRAAGADGGLISNLRSGTLQ